MNIKLTAASLQILGAIISATDANGENSGCGYVAATYPAGKALIDAGLIETRSDVTNGDGEVGARPTAAGREYAKTGTLNAAEKPAAQPRKSFVIDDDVPLPPKTRAPVEQMYPFDQLEIGKSFFVADTEVKSGKAYATLQSTVSSANDRYSEPTGEMRPNKRNSEKMVPVKRSLRRFELRHFEQGGVSGARVFRVAVED